MVRRGRGGVVLAYIPESVDANTQIDVCAFGVPTADGFLPTCLVGFFHKSSGNFL